MGNLPFWGQHSLMLRHNVSVHLKPVISDILQGIRVNMDAVRLLILTIQYITVDSVATSGPALSGCNNRWLLNPAVF